jgi:hypothetical protein
MTGWGVGSSVPSVSTIQPLQTACFRYDRHQADSTVAVLVVVPLEEQSAVSASVLDRAEALREVAIDPVVSACANNTRLGGPATLLRSDKFWKQPRERLCLQDVGAFGTGNKTMTRIYSFGQDDTQQYFTAREEAIAEAKLTAEWAKTNVDVVVCYIVKGTPSEVAVALLKRTRWCVKTEVIATAQWRPK